jgi:hypothetical protein
MSYHYPDVPGILHDLQSEGLPLSAPRVRERRGEKGSLQSIQEDINRGKGERSVTTPDAALAEQYIPLPPNEAEVECHLNDLRGEGALLELMDHLERLIASARALEPLEQTACNWLYHRLERDMGETITDIGRWSALHSSTQQVIAAASSELKELRRGYQRLQQGAVHGDLEVAQ